jgi:3-phenylpropionate/cinnamic acid dioxygenase small subunit
MTVIERAETGADISSQDYTACSQFLSLEATLLDENRLWEWFELLADDFTCHVPVRVALPRAATDKDPHAEFKTGTYHIKDNKGSTRVRIERLFTGYAWSEDPPSRTVRSVGSVRVSGLRNASEFEVSSALVLYRERGLEPDHQLICGNRSDVIRRTDSGLKLVERTVRLAHTIVDTPNLGLFL